MIGFELDVNGKTVSAALESGVVSLIALQVAKEDGIICELKFTGLDTSEKENYLSIDWHKSDLKIGDELTIKVKDIINNSEPTAVRKK